jgi:hypothetical protein
VSVLSRWAGGAGARRARSRTAGCDAGLTRGGDPHTPDHDATFWSLGPDAVRKVVDPGRAKERLALETSPTCSCSRTAAQRWALRSPSARADSAFDSSRKGARGSEHGSCRRAGGALAGRATAARVGSVAPVFPFALLLVPDEQVPDPLSFGDAGRRGLAEIPVDVLGRLIERSPRRPACLIHQRPFDGGEWPGRGCTSRCLALARPSRARLHRRRFRLWCSPNWWRPRRPRSRYEVAAIRA